MVTFAQVPSETLYVRCTRICASYHSEALLMPALLAPGWRRRCCGHRNHLFADALYARGHRRLLLIPNYTPKMRPRSHTPLILSQRDAVFLHHTVPYFLGRGSVGAYPVFHMPTALTRASL